MYSQFPVPGDSSGRLSGSKTPNPYLWLDPDAEATKNGRCRKADKKKYSCPFKKFKTRDFLRSILSDEILLEDSPDISS